MRSTTPLMLLGASLLLLSCGGGGGGGKSNPDLGIQLQIDPASPSMNTGESTTYVANVGIPGVGMNLYSDSRFGIQWSATGGTLQDVQGQGVNWKTYTAPTTPGTYQVTLQSTYNPSTRVTSNVTVARPPVAQSLVSSRSELYQGESATLTPVFSDGTGVLQPGNQPVQSGVPIQVTPLRTTQYRLVVSNTIGRTATQTCTLPVQARGVFAPLPTWTPFTFSGHGEGLLPDGKVLVLANGMLTGPPSSYTLDPSTWQFTPTTGAPSGTYQAPMTAHLSDGSVLVYGTNWSRIGVAEVYAPASGTFTPVDTTSMAADSLVTALPVGGSSLLLAGFKGVASYSASGQKLGPVTPYPSGFSFAAAVPYADTRALFISYYGAIYVFDTATSTFTALTGIPSDLGTPTQAVQLRNGKIFLTGAYSSGGGNGQRTYLLDPSSGLFSAAVPLLVARDESTLPVLLNDGRVVLSGFRLQPGPAEIFDPSLGTSCQLPDLDSMVGSSHATVLADGRVLYLGSTTGAVFDPSQTPPADPKLGSFAQTGSLTVPRHPGALTLLQDGTVLVTGGNMYESAANQKAVELFDPAKGTFRRLGDLLVSRSGHSATLLPSGKVLVFGGGGGLNTTDPLAELYDPAAGSSQALPFQDWGRSGHKALTLPNGLILIVGGQRQGLIFDPATSQFQTTGSMSGDPANMDAALLPDGKVLVVPGRTYGTGATQLASEIYDSATGLFSAGGSMGTQSMSADLVSLGNGTVLAATNTAAEIYSPSVSGFVPAGGLLHTKDDVHPVLLADGTVLVLQGRTTAPTQIFLPTLNGGIGGFIEGPTQLSIATPFPKAALLKDGRVLVVEATGCQIYIP